MAVLDLLAGGAEMDEMSRWPLKGGHVVDWANGRDHRWTEYLARTA